MINPVNDTDEIEEIKMKKNTKDLGDLLGNEIPGNLFNNLASY